MNVENALQTHPVANEQRFCINCLHFRPKAIDRTHGCVAPAVRRIDLVRGYVAVNCDALRADDGKCGPAGSLFELALDAYQGTSSAPSLSRRSSLSMMNRASSDSSASTAPTSVADPASP